MGTECTEGIRGKRSWWWCPCQSHTQEVWQTLQTAPGPALAARAHSSASSRYALQLSLASLGWAAPQSLLQTHRAPRVRQKALLRWAPALCSLTICSWTLLLACENACCSSLRKFSDFWHLAISKEILKKENPHRERYKAQTRFWRRNNHWCSLTWYHCQHILWNFRLIHWNLCC